MTDETALIRAAQNGDAAAFEQLLEAHYERIYRFALRWCGHAQDAEDITQQACIKLARGIRLFQFEAAFSSWLYRLVINCAKDWRRAQKTESTVSLDQDDFAGRDSPSQSDQGEVSVYLRQVLREVERIGDEMKETVVLVLGEGLSHSEAAAILNIEESTVSWRIHKVRQTLSPLTRGGHQ